MDMTTNVSVMVMGLVDDADVLAAYEAVQVPSLNDEYAGVEPHEGEVNGAVVLEKALQDLWEATSFELDKLQSNTACAEQKQKHVKNRHKPAWKLTYEPRATPAERQMSAWLMSA